MEIKKYIVGLAFLSTLATARGEDLSLKQFNTSQARLSSPLDVTLIDIIPFHNKNPFDKITKVKKWEMYK